MQPVKVSQALSDPGQLLLVATPGSEPGGRWFDSNPRQASAEARARAGRGHGLFRQRVLRVGREPVGTAQDADRPGRRQHLPGEAGRLRPRATPRTFWSKTGRGFATPRAYAGHAALSIASGSSFTGLCGAIRPAGGSPSTEFPVGFVTRGGTRLAGGSTRLPRARAVQPLRGKMQSGQIQKPRNIKTRQREKF
jgi:hypothetical protein